MARIPKGPKVTRRSVLKGIGALAADAAMGFPRIRNAPRKVAKAVTTATNLTPQWIQNMVSWMKHTTPGELLTQSRFPQSEWKMRGEITKLKNPKVLGENPSQYYLIKNADGSSEIVSMRETPNDIELRWDDANGERQDRVIRIDKSNNGKTEIINEIEKWEDAPDPKATYEDSDVYDISKDELRKEMILDGSFKKLDDVDERIYDEWSVPFDKDEELSNFFERYVDTFSPSGNIFDTKQRKINERVRERKTAEFDEDVWENQFRGGYGMHSYNTGGEVYGTMKDVVPPLDARQAYPRGGSVFKRTKLPKPVTKVATGQQRIEAPKRTRQGPDLKPIKTDLYEAPPGPYTITDASGVRILDKDFKELAEAQQALDELATLRTTDPTEFKIVGARPPKTPEGVSEGAPTVLSKKEQKQLITEKQFDETREPAMFWKSREIIAEAPMGAMKGEQWIRYLKNKGVGESELVDTSLGFHLSQQAGMKVNKADLLKDFDSVAPKIEAKMQGFRDNNSAIKRVKSYLKKLKEKPPINLTTPVRNVIAHLERSIGGMDLEKTAKSADNAKGLEKAADDAFAREFGVDGISSIRPDTKIDFLAKKIGMMLDDAVNLQGMQYKVSKKPGYAGSQVLPGGYNYNEIVFTFKPGKYRLNEPKFSSGHFSGTDNLFVWVRTSDRVDEYGRRFIFIEEIQSDMHQSARGKSGEGARSGKGYKPRADVYDESSMSRAGNEARLDEIQNSIDDILEGNLNQSGKSLDELRLEQEALIKGFQKMGDTRSSRYKSSSDIPEGPFPDSKDYGKFVVQYLLRLAKENDYNGVALSSNRIKNRQEGHGGMGIEAMEAGKHTGFYKNIMIPQMRKIGRKSGAIFDDDIVIVDSNGVVWDKIPALIIKDERGIIESAKKMDKGISAYATGGLVRSAFNPIVPPLNPGVL